MAGFHVPLSVSIQYYADIVTAAAYTGVFAMKPTFNTISTAGIRVVMHEIGTVGYFARSVEDLHLFTQVLTDRIFPPWQLPDPRNT